MGYSLAVQYNGGGCSEHLLGSMVNKKLVNSKSSMTTIMNNFRNPSEKIKKSNLKKTSIHLNDMLDIKGDNN